MTNANDQHRGSATEGIRVQDQPATEARQQARDERDTKENSPHGGSRLLALANESEKPYEMQTRDGKWVKFGWTAETPSEWLALIEGRVRSVRRYADSERPNKHLIWGALLDLHLMIDAMEAYMLLKETWREPVEVPDRRRTIAT